MPPYETFGHMKLCQLTTALPVDGTATWPQSSHLDDRPSRAPTTATVGSLLLLLLGMSGQVRDLAWRLEDAALPRVLCVWSCLNHHLSSLHTAPAHAILMTVAT